MARDFIPKNPAHPGEILAEEFLRELGYTQAGFARHIGVKAAVINEICRGKRGVSPSMALLFSMAFGTSAQWWMSMQSLYELAHAQTRGGPQMRRVKPIVKKAS